MLDNIPITNMEKQENIMKKIQVKAGLTILLICSQIATGMVRLPQAVQKTVPTTRAAGRTTVVSQNMPKDMKRSTTKGTMHDYPDHGFVEGRFIGGAIEPVKGGIPFSFGRQKHLSSAERAIALGHAIVGKQLELNRKFTQALEAGNLNQAEILHKEGARLTDPHKQEIVDVFERELMESTHKQDKESFKEIMQSINESDNARLKQAIAHEKLDAGKRGKRRLLLLFSAALIIAVAETELEGVDAELHTALKRKDFDAAKKALDNGANANALYTEVLPTSGHIWVNTPLTVALQGINSKTVELVALLIQHGALPNGPTQQQVKAAGITERYYLKTPLSKLINNTHPSELKEAHDIIDVLAKAGMDVNYRGDGASHETPVLFSDLLWVYRGNFEVNSDLLRYLYYKYDLDLNIKHSYHKSPLSYIEYISKHGDPKYDNLQIASLVKSLMAEKRVVSEIEGQLKEPRSVVAKSAKQQSFLGSWFAKLFGKKA